MSNSLSISVKHFRPFGSGSEESCAFLGGLTQVSGLICLGFTVSSYPDKTIQFWFGFGVTKLFPALRLDVISVVSTS